MLFGSLFSGIGGFELGFERAGMECVWQCENDRHARQVLASHWPGVICYEDVKDVGKGCKPVDLICGGFPCQDISIAGKRAGLAGSRSGLWFEFARVIDELEPRWVVIENVPGLLSSNGGRDFAVIIRWLADRGYGVAWRVLDSQYFGVAQRRRRVFVVGSFGSGRAAQVLFESEGVPGDIAADGKARQGAAERTESGIDADCWVPGKAHAVRTMSGGVDREDMHTLIMAHGQANAEIIRDVSPSLTANHEQPIVMSASYVGIRRLTPVECERLQGFPDGWTAGQADSHRYKQLGNAVTVNVAEWIGKRILVADERIK